MAEEFRMYRLWFEHKVRGSHLNGFVEYFPGLSPDDAFKRYVESNPGTFGHRDSLGARLLEGKEADFPGFELKIGVPKGKTTAE